MLLGRLPGDFGQSVQVHARAEGFAGAGQNDGAGRARLRLVERGEQLLDHLGGDGVALLGAVESDDSALTVELKR